MKAFLLPLLLCSCSSGDVASVEETDDDAEYSAYEEQDIPNAAEDDWERRGDETYDEYSDRRDGYDGAQGSFRGYGCTQDCSGHEAGYNWAESNGITDPDQCGGKSWSFIEGCRAYAEEQ